MRRRGRVILLILSVGLVIAQASWYWSNRDSTSSIFFSRKFSLSNGNEEYDDHAIYDIPGSSHSRIDGEISGGRPSGKTSLNSHTTNLLSQKKKIRSNNLQRIKALRKRLELMDIEEPTAEWNMQTLDRLASCYESETCGPGEETVILLASYHFVDAHKGKTSGEDIWALSTINAFEYLNHTMLHSQRTNDTLLVYQYIPDMIRLVIWESSGLNACAEGNITLSSPGAINDPALQHLRAESPSKRGMKRIAERDIPMEDEEVETDQDREQISWGVGIGNNEKEGSKDRSKGCMKTKEYPEGVPVWKSFAFHFWGDPQSPLGPKWTLAPYDRGPWRTGMVNQYLGYTVQQRCEQTPYLLSAEREHRAFVLGKWAGYFDSDRSAFPNMLEYVADRIHPSQGSAFKFTASPSMSSEDEKIKEPGVEVVKIENQKGWFETLSKSKVLLGIGNPALSPSPFDALCLGVPFINPILKWDEEDPSDRKLWITQHDHLLNLDPPYVYHVQAQNVDELLEAMTKAIQNPIQRYYPPGMSFDEIVARHKELVETDWQWWAEETVDPETLDAEFPFLLS